MRTLTGEEEIERKSAVKDLEAKTKEAEEATTRAETAEQIAKDKRAKAAPGKFSADGALQMLPEFTELAGALIEKKVETFDAFVDKLSKHFGRKPKVETLPVLQQAWDTAWDIAKNPKGDAPSATKPKAKPAKQTIAERLAKEGQKNIDKGFKALGAMRGKTYSIETASAVDLASEFFASELRGKTYSIETATAEVTQALYKIALGYSKQSAARGVSSLADFLSRVNKRFGPDAKDYEAGLIQAFNQVQAEKSAEPTAAPAVSIEPDKPDSLVGAAKALFRHFLSEGITETDSVIDAVHNELRDQFPDEIGERLDTMKAMVDYDKTKLLEVKKATEILKAELLEHEKNLALSIQEMTKGWTAKDMRRFIHSDHGMKIAVTCVEYFLKHAGT